MDPKQWRPVSFLILKFNCSHCQYLLTFLAVRVCVTTCTCSFFVFGVFWVKLNGFLGSWGGSGGNRVRMITGSQLRDEQPRRLGDTQTHRRVVPH